MFTRCPKCKAVHPLTAAALSRSTGLVKCGRCDRIFNALSFLSDDWHASQPVKPSDTNNGELPVLGGHGRRKRSRPTALANQNTRAATEDMDDGTSQTSPDIAAEALAGSDRQEDADDPSAKPQPSASRNSPQGWVWSLLAVSLLLITLANMAWTFKDGWIQRPVVQKWLQDKGWVDKKVEKPPGLFKDTAKIQLVSRDMHTHPTRTGILVLSVTFVNLAEKTQAYPVLRITLLDGGNRPVAQRRFQADEYLRAGSNTQSGLAPDVFLPVLLELADPGEQAVGFEIEFL